MSVNFLQNSSQVSTEGTVHAHCQIDVASWETLRSIHFVLIACRFVRETSPGNTGHMDTLDNMPAHHRPDSHTMWAVWWQKFTYLHVFRRWQVTQANMGRCQFHIHRQRRIWRPLVTVLSFEPHDRPEIPKYCFWTAYEAHQLQIQYLWCNWLK